VNKLTSPISGSVPWLLLVALACLAGGPSRAQDPALVFSTYLGGPQEDQVRDVEVDAQGRVYVTGGTQSPNFPIQANASGHLHDSTHNGNYDVFLSKFDVDGSLLWSTFLGGSAYDRAYAVDVDNQGNVYVAGRAGSDFPVTAGAFQTVFQGGRARPGDPYGDQDGFVCKFSTDGVREFCSYFGNSDGWIVRDVAVDGTGNIYIAAASWGSNYPAPIAGAFLNSPLGGSDAVVAKISGDGSQVVWARYLGGSGWDSNENSVAVDAAGNPTVLFTTESSGIATAGAYDTTYGGDQDVFLVRLTGSGDLTWGSYLGGPLNESTETHELAVSPSGQVYVAVPTMSADSAIPLSPQTVLRRYGPGGGNNELLLARHSFDGTTLEAVTFIGGNGNDRAEGIAVDTSGSVFLTGTTTSSNFPVTPGALWSDSGGNDAIIVLLTADLELVYATYMGGAGTDYGRGAAAVGGRLYAGGMINSPDFPTSSALQASAPGSGEWDAWVAGFTWNVAVDSDGDSISDDVDNCPVAHNPGQADLDGDGAGDACDACPNDADDDLDGDGVCGDVDNCPGQSNSNQSDADSDGLGDSCDPCPNGPGADTDGDGVCDSTDNCPGDFNTGQLDADADGAGDACDTCPSDPNDDRDGDGLCGDVDNCPSIANTSQSDTDGDGIGDSCDYCLADCRSCDANGDERMDGVELAWIGRAFGYGSPNPEIQWWYPVDYNSDGAINGNDLAILARFGIWGRTTDDCNQSE